MTIAQDYGCPKAGQRVTALRAQASSAPLAHVLAVTLSTSLTAVFGRARCGQSTWFRHAGDDSPPCPRCADISGINRKGTE